jgi:hypothetical protein
MVGLVLLGGGSGLVWGMARSPDGGGPTAFRGSGQAIQAQAERPPVAAPPTRSSEAPYAWLAAGHPAASGAGQATAGRSTVSSGVAASPPLPVPPLPPSAAAAQSRPWECQPFKAEGPPREFHFTRGIYSSGGGGGFGRRSRRGSWCIDHPKAEEQFLGVLDRLTGIDAHPWGNAISLADPDLRRHPILYMLEVGYMGMTEAEVEGLRSYLLAGGFLIIDDFWGSRQWFNFQEEMRRVFPEYAIVELPSDHQVYRTYYQVDTVLQVPAFRGGWRDYSDTSEQDGYVAQNFGIFHDDGRLMVAVNWNTDLGDAWEWMEQPTYPLRFSTYAYQMGVNYIIYGMSN